MKIDPSTGLPELPSGEYWRIEEHRVSIRRDTSAGEWEQCSHTALQCDLMRRERRTMTAVAVRSSWGRLRQKPATITECRARAESETLHSREWGVWERINIGDYLNRPFPHRVLKEPDRVTRSNVVERCEAVLAERDAREQSKAIFGNYPPNRIEGAS